MKECSTSSLIININESTFARLLDKYKIIQYDLPGFFPSWMFGALHNWAKSNVNYPYYLNFPTKSIYVLVKKEEGVPELLYENKSLGSRPFNNYKEVSFVHIWLKVLMAQFLEKEGVFVSNDNFYIHAELNRAQSFATVLKINVKHDYKEKNAIIFNIEDLATRLKKVKLSEYKEYYSKEVPYGLSFIGGEAVFKQLKKEQIDSFQDAIFVKPRPSKNNKGRSKINYHSILDEAEYEKSKAYLVQNFISQFISYLSENDVNVSQKVLKLEKVHNQSKEGSLTMKSFQVAVIDGRINKEIPLKSMLMLPESFKNSVKLVQKELNQFDEETPALFVMDYNNEGFKDYFENEEDPYLMFKANSTLKKVAKQGFCVNENSFHGDVTIPFDTYFNYKGLGSNDLSRNFSISLTQLFLKNALLSQDARAFPFLDLLQERIFLLKGVVFYIKDELLKIEEVEDIEQLDKLISDVIGRNDLFDVLDKIYDYHHPFKNKGTEFDFVEKCRLIISKSNVVELIDYAEKAFYDEDEVQTRIKERNKKRPVSEFKVGKSTLLAQEYNEFIDENVEELSISYETLKTKYGKGEEGFISQIFNGKNEKPFLKFLSQNSELPIKGLKQDNLFATYSGVWFDSVNNQYFVGRKLNYNKKQDKGFQMKKIIVHDGNFEPETFFPLLNIDFIRFKEFTVNPYPFKLIEMMNEIKREGSKDLIQL